MGIELQDFNEKKAHANVEVSGLDDGSSVASTLKLEDQTALRKRKWWHKEQIVRDLDSVATKPSVYDDPSLAKLYQPCEEWENLHRFDPSARWTWREENPLVRKIDWRIALWACIMFMALQIDRSNLSNALTDSFLDDLGMTTNDYNYGNTIFKVAFACAEIPSQLVSKRLGPDRWIPIQMMLWSIVGLSQFWLSGRGSFLATRALLGAMQGGFIPDLVLYLSYFYKSSELAVRLGWFWTADTLGTIASSFMSYGLLHLGLITNHAGWRWIFLVEGLLTFVIGAFSWFLMPASPTQTKGGLRGKRGWFSEREETIMVNRVIRDDPSKGTMHNRQAIDLKLIWRCLTDYDMWPVYAVGLMFEIPTTPPSQYLTLTLKSLGFGTFNSNLLAIPYAVGSIIMLNIHCWLSTGLNERALTGLIPQFWSLPFLIFLVVRTSSASSWSVYGVLTTLLSAPTAHAVQVAWCSANSGNVALRTVSSAIYNVSVQISAIAASNIYRADDKPLYHRGNRQLVAINAANIVLYILVKVYYTTRNKRRERKWNSMSEEERETYLRTTTDEGNKRLNFRFAH
ncbi:phthalate transporter [Dipodascopsis tothii]|uniref:phthalate transporter n=1 Tax=Dipodascopsis tothii TaxID=44089 RepID=UPI0034CE2F0F